jgi:integrase
MTTFFDKKRKKWQYEFELDGRRYGPRAAVHPVTKQLATTKREADAVEETVRVAARMAPKIAKAGESIIADIVAALHPTWEGQARAKNIEVYEKEILQFFGAESSVTSALTQIRVDDFVTHLKIRTIKRWHGGPKLKPHDPVNARKWKDSGKKLRPATINLYLGVLAQIVERAALLRDEATKERVLKEPPTVPHQKKDKRKPRPVPTVICGWLLENLAKHAGEAFGASLRFGFRRGEIFSLTISDVDFEKGGVNLRAERVKDKEDEFLPGTADDMAFMQALVDQAKERGTKFLITYRRGKNHSWEPIKKPKSAWKRVMAKVKEAYGETWRWHDVRAAYISHIAKTNPLGAQKLARHSDYATTALYVGIDDDFKRQVIEKAGQHPALKIVKAA